MPRLQGTFLYLSELLLQNRVRPDLFLLERDAIVRLELHVVEEAAAVLRQ